MKGIKSSYWIVSIFSLMIIISFLYSIYDDITKDRRLFNMEAAQVRISAEIGISGEDGEIVQSIRPEKDNFDRIDVLFSPSSVLKDTVIAVELVDTELNSVIYYEEHPGEDIELGKNFSISFSEIRNAKDREYSLRISLKEWKPDSFLVMYASQKDNYSRGNLKVGEEYASGDLWLTMGDVEEKPVLSITSYFIICLLIVAIFILGLICFYYSRKIHMSYLFTSIIIGTLFVFVVTPYDYLDEEQHFYRAYEISEGNILGKKYDNNYGNYISAGILNSINLSRSYMEDLEVSIFTTAENNSIIDLNSKERVLVRNYAATYSPVIYIPEVIGIWIGRLLGLMPLAMMYLGRIFNMIFYSLMLTAAIKITPIKKELFYLIGLLPMALAHGAALSADAMTNSSAFLFISYILYLSYGNVEHITLKNKIVLGILGSLIAFAKVTYIPILALSFIIPISKFGGKKDYLKNIFIIIMIPLFLFAIWNLMVINEYLIPDVRVNPKVSPKDQVIYALSNPIEYLGVIIRSFRVNGFDYLLTMIGRSLTTRTIALPKILIYIMSTMLLLTAILTNKGSKEAEISTKVKMLLGGVGLATVILIASALYAGFTPVGSDYIDGIQGRYFLPLLPLFLLLFNNNRFKIAYSRKIFISVMTYTLLFITIIYIFNSINR